MVDFLRRRGYTQAGAGCELDVRQHVVRSQVAVHGRSIGGIAACRPLEMPFFTYIISLYDSKDDRVMSRCILMEEPGFDECLGGVLNTAQLDEATNSFEEKSMQASHA